jgi:nicotinamide mononucleotide transporter
MIAIFATMIMASYWQWWPIGMVDALGFATGGMCVWLTVRQDVWNWPLGLANNVFFFVLFLRARLFADMWLQSIYFALGVYGWLSWLRGGERRTRLRVSRATRGEWWALTVFVVVSTLAIREALINTAGKSPLWDSLSTTLSLAAQYLLCRKRLENWFVWILADLIYIPLYIYAHLPLTAALYGVFLIMCFFGLRAWLKSLRLQRGD